MNYRKIKKRHKGYYFAEGKPALCEFSYLGKTFVFKAIPQIREVNLSEKQVEARDDYNNTRLKITASREATVVVDFNVVPLNKKTLFYFKQKE